MTQGSRTGDEAQPASEIDSDGDDQANAALLETAIVESDLAPVPSDDGLPEKLGTFFAFRYFNYRLLWIGDLFTAAAQWIQQTTLSWVVYDITGSGSVLGLMNLIRIIPTLCFSPFAGAATDRMSRNRIIAVSQFCMAIFTFVLAIGLALHKVEIWHLFLFTLLVGTAQTFNMPARQTFVFDVVPRRVVPNAVALSWLAFSLARSIGPAVGGLLIVLFGPSNNFFLQAVAYLSVMITILMIKSPPREAIQGASRSFIRTMKEGYTFAASDPLARIMVIMSLISPLLIIPLHAALLPIFAKRVFHADAAALGILVGSIGFGGLFGGLLTASLNNVDRRGMLQLTALFIFSLSETVFSLLAYFTGNLFIAVPFLVIAGAAESLYTTTNTSVLQLLAPERMRGSMASILQLSFLVMPIGSLIAGTGADAFGAPAVGAIITFMAFCVGLLIFIFSPRMRNLRLSQLTQTATVRAAEG